MLLVAAGFVAGRRNWLRAEAVGDLSNLVFLLLIPALLFRTMSGVRFEQLDLLPIVAYFPAALLWFALQLAWRGFNPRSVVLALAGTFSNNVMIGVTLVELAWGRAGLVTLLTLVSVHSLILLTTSSVLVELAQARQDHAAGGNSPRLLATAASALRGALIHPIPLPIACGLLYAQTGWGIPPLVDKPLQLLGAAFGPVSLLLVGISLARTRMQGQWREALLIACGKNVALPALVAIGATLAGLEGLAWTVVVVAAGLPTGANVYLFAQRYRVAQPLTTATLGLSTALALPTLSAVMLLAPGSLV